MKRTKSAVVSELDWRSGEMLRAIKENGGEATTTTIRDETGMNNSKVSYRRRKLVEMGLIEVETAYGSKWANPPKKHVLTDDGLKLIQRGLLEEIDAPPPGDFDKMAEQLTRMRDRLESLESRLTAVETDQNTMASKLEGYSDLSDPTVAEAISELQEQIDELDEQKKDKRF